MDFSSGWRRLCFCLPRPATSRHIPGDRRTGGFQTLGALGDRAARERPSQPGFDAGDRRRSRVRGGDGGEPDARIRHRLHRHDRGRAARHGTAHSGRQCVPTFAPLGRGHHDGGPWAGQSAHGYGFRTGDRERHTLRPSIATSFPAGWSYYHSLQVTAEKRMSRGLTFQSAWTWSKFMEATSYLNDTDWYLEKVISNQDFPHRVRWSGSWGRPGGRAKPL